MAFTHEWALNYIKAGRSGKSRPLYFRCLSLRALDPNDPNTDITVAYRWRHRYADLGDKDIGETLDPTKGVYRYPISIIKSDNTMVLSTIWKHQIGPRKFWARFVPEEFEVFLSNGVKVHQKTDQLKQVTRKPRSCKWCAGVKSTIATCWTNYGVIDEDLQQTRFDNPCYYYEDESNHTNHIITMSCSSCKGTGLAGKPLNRFDSYVWDKNVDLVVDLKTGLLIGEGGNSNVLST